MGAQSARLKKLLGMWIGKNNNSALAFQNLMLAFHFELPEGLDLAVKMLTSDGGQPHVRQYALPITHVITFNPLSERITSAQMRRALSFSINREAILKSIVLRDQTMRYGRPSSAPWHLASYATNPLEKPPEFNLRLAYALRYAAERQLQLAELAKREAEAKAEARVAGEEFNSDEFRKAANVSDIRLPSLRMVVDPDPTAIEAAERIALYWKKIGVDIELIPGNQSGSAYSVNPPRPSTSAGSAPD